ncbi:MAG: class II fructose-bisphosphatase [Bacillota bacterium]
MKSGLFKNLINVTEKAALSAADLIGSEDKNAIDQAAVDAMRKAFSAINIGGRVVVGEGEKDRAPSFLQEEKVGMKSKHEIDLAIDPIEGTEFVAKNKANSVAVLAAVEKNKLQKVPDIYMEKIITGPEAKGKISLAKTPAENLKAVAKAKNKKVNQLKVAVLERARHEELIKQIKDAGAEVKLIPGIDVVWGIAAAHGNLDIDLLMGSGGAPEGILTAAAVKCLGGDMETKLCPRNEREHKKVLNVGINNSNRIFKLDEMIRGEEILFSLTGVTDGILVDGIQNGVANSIVMQKNEEHEAYVREMKTDYLGLKNLKIG